MKTEIMKRINDLFDSYDLFSSRKEKVIEAVKKEFPDITDAELKEFKEYLEGFYHYCLEYGDKLAQKFKTPFLPGTEEAEKEVAEYVAACREKYPEIDEKHIIGIFSMDCWLSNR